MTYGCNWRSFEWKLNYNRPRRKTKILKNGQSKIIGEYWPDMSLDTPNKSHIRHELQFAKHSHFSVNAYEPSGPVHRSETPTATPTWKETRVQSRMVTTIARKMKNPRQTYNQSMNNSDCLCTAICKWDETVIILSEQGSSSSWLPSHGCLKMMVNIQLACVSATTRLCGSSSQLEVTKYKFPVSSHLITNEPWIAARDPWEGGGERARWRGRIPTSTNTEGTRERREKEPWWRWYLIHCQATRDTQRQ